MSNVEEIETPMDTNENSVRKSDNSNENCKKQRASICERKIHPLWNFCIGVRVCVWERENLTTISCDRPFYYLFWFILVFVFTYTNIFKETNNHIFVYLYRTHRPRMARHPITRTIRILMPKLRQIAANVSISCWNKRRSFPILFRQWDLVQNRR